MSEQEINLTNTETVIDLVAVDDCFIDISAPSIEVVDIVETGPAGPQGLAGPEGPTGPEGPEGPVGPTGSAADLTAHLADSVPHPNAQSGRDFAALFRTGLI